MTEELNKILYTKNSKLETLVGYFPKLKEEDINKIENLKFSFVHLDFDLYQSTIDTFNFIRERLEKNAIILFDDYNLINQEGVKKAIEDLKIDLDENSNAKWPINSFYLIFLLKIQKFKVKLFEKVKYIFCSVAIKQKVNKLLRVLPL